jgi:peptidoglycan/LPS O-acetylase OafA/YrhL
VFGELKIVPSAAAGLGDLGRQQGQATTYDWKWYYSAAGMLIWLALIVALLVPKANRNRHILWILAPVLVLNLLWWAFKELSDMPSSPASQFDALFQSLVIGIAVLWLVARYFDKFGWLVRVLASFGTLVAVACLGILSYSIKLSNETALFLALLIFLALTMLVAIALSQRLCGGKYYPVRFMLWLALWTLVGSLVAIFGFVIAGSLIMSGGPDLSEPQVITMLVLGGLVFGLCLYTLNLPFMILGFANPFFRKRFCACLGLEPVSTIAGSETHPRRPNLQDAELDTP